MSATRDALVLRARVYGLIRRFFEARHVLEVETPILSRAGNTEPNIDSFTTTFSGPVDAGARQRWLRTSPEYPLKRLLAAGVGDCYELGRVFRNGEAGRRHNPEFTMLEWYRVGWDHRQLIDETVALITEALEISSLRYFFESISYSALFMRFLSMDPNVASIDTLRAALAGHEIRGDGLERDDWLDLLMTHRIQPALPPHGITAVYDWPASQCALARIRDGDPPVAERFEIYVGSHEVANGYHELNDAAEQRARFEIDNQRRRQRGMESVPLDAALLAVLGEMPACAGVALGIERLLMCVSGDDDIRHLLAFAFADA